MTRPDRVVFLALFVALASNALALDPPAYIHAEDSSFRWTAKSTTAVQDAQVTVIRLTSQTWQGMKWRHWMHVIVPDRITRPGHALLLVTGGHNSKKTPGPLPGEVALIRGLAVRTGSVMVVLEQVPNQPLFDGMEEDELVAHTFAQFLETKDESWPALLPMAKAAIRAMDAAQAFLKEKYDSKVEKFVVTGASKRGWTTWLTGAFDSRVEAIAPMVIDTLNIPAQMRLQVETFGEFSEQIRDYTELGLQEKLKEPTGQRLVQLIDPYSYCDRFTMPKLIVLGTNDRYWPVDAIKLYYGDLPGEKHIHYVPNAGHNLGPGAVEAIASFYVDVVDGSDRPKFEWTTALVEGASVTTVTAPGKPVRVELWTAASGTRDFRDARWSSVPLEIEAEKSVARVAVPETGFAAYHVRLTYRSALGDEYGLCTNVEVVGGEEK